MSPREKHPRRTQAAILSLAGACLLVSGFVLTDLPSALSLRLAGGPAFSWKAELLQALWPRIEPSPEPPTYRGPLGPNDTLPMDLPGIRLPPTCPGDAGMWDEANVIGVCVGGKARAYVIDVMSSPDQHVVNDVLGDHPVTVTYCNLKNCARTFTGDSRGQPLDVGVGGWIRGGLALRVGGANYAQETGAALDEGAAPFPYAEYPCQLVKWKDWHREHPDSDVYLGMAPPPMASLPGSPKQTP